MPGIRHMLGILATCVEKCACQAYAQAYAQHMPAILMGIFKKLRKQAYAGHIPIPKNARHMPIHICWQGLLAFLVESVGKNMPGICLHLGLSKF